MARKKTAKKKTAASKGTRSALGEGHGTCYYACAPLHASWCFKTSGSDLIDFRGSHVRAMRAFLHLTICAGTIKHPNETTSAGGRMLSTRRSKKAVSYAEEASGDEEASAASGTEYNTDDEDQEIESKKTTGRVKKVAKRRENKEEEDYQPAEHRSKRATKMTGTGKKPTVTAVDSPIISHFTQKMLENPTKKTAATKKSASFDSDSDEDEYRNVEGERTTSAKFEVSV